MRLNELNNQLATLSPRERAEDQGARASQCPAGERVGRAESHHLHLRKVAEVLPMCICLRESESGNAKWQDVAEGLQIIGVTTACVPREAPLCVGRLTGNDTVRALRAFH
jgi:hypothetical protein